MHFSLICELFTFLFLSFLPSSFLPFSLPSSCSECSPGTIKDLCSQLRCFNKTRFLASRLWSSAEARQTSLLLRHSWDLTWRIHFNKRVSVNKILVKFVVYVYFFLFNIFFVLHSFCTASSCLSNIWESTSKKLHLLSQNQNVCIKGIVSPKNENSVIIYSSSCFWKAGWGFGVHKTLPDFHRKEALLWYPT